MLKLEFFLREIFVRSLHFFFRSYFENVLPLFTEIEYGKTQTRFIRALGRDAEEKS